MSETTPVQDLQAEQAVLGAVLLDGNRLDDILNLEPRDFSQKRHELIYQSMRYLHDMEKPVDALTVAEHFLRRNRIEDMGGPTYLVALVNACPSASNARYYANIVRSLAHRRRGNEIADEIKKLADEDFESDEEYFAAVEDKVADLRPQMTGKMRNFKETRKEYYEHLKSKAKKLRTGLFKQFDEWAMLWIGWLYILAGRPGVGKTAKALMLAYGIAKHNPGSGAVLLYSQEMGEDEVKDRMVSMVAEVNYNRLINKGGDDGFTDAEQVKIDKAYAELEQLPIYIQDSAGVTIDEIRGAVKQFKKKHGRVAAVIVDYLQIMEIPLRKNENRAQGIGRITRTAKTLARNMKFVFIMLSQLDRAADEEEPKLKHLKESGSIEQDADVVEFLHWNPKSQEGSGKVIDSIFAKGRNVGLNRFKLRFKFWYQKYEEIEPKKEASRK